MLMNSLDVLVKVALLNESLRASFSLNVWTDVGLLSCVSPQMVQKVVDLVKYETAVLHVTLEDLLVAPSVRILVLVDAELLG
jgi:hypothetical protein